MARPSLSSVRLYLEADLSAGAVLDLAGERAHYLVNVMRLGPGAGLDLFNGRDGEWRGEVAAAGRGRCRVTLTGRLREQAAGADLWLAFAPLKRARLDTLVEKAAELGVAALQPVLTRRSAVRRVNAARLARIAIEAAEQCDRLTVPEVRQIRPLGELLADWPAGRRLLYCDESGEAAPAADVLAGVPPARRPPWAVLIGPEGGFAPEERQALRAHPCVVSVGLGPRLLRAETAALAALVLWQAHVGDWRGG